MPDDDVRFMRQAIRQAWRGVGRTSPNPSVGAIVVRRGRVIARGFTRPPGGPHAEALALQRAGARARGATLYVTLEPCAHHGRTPPCVDAVRAAGIARVVIGSRDPNPSVAGNGAGKLRRAGIEVVLGVEKGACDELIRAFRKHVTSGMPWVTLKLAASIDGRIATSSGESKWITGESARAAAHRLRDRHDAVLVGVETIVRDDPALTCRVRGGRDPLRVVLDSRLRIPEAARVLTNKSTAGTVVATALRGGAKAERLRDRGARVVTVPRRPGGLSLPHVLRWLGRHEVMSVLIEGGAAVAASALRAKVVDRMALFLAPKVIGGDGRPMIDSLDIARIDRAIGIEDFEVQRIGPDVMLTGRPDVSAAKRR